MSDEFLSFQVGITNVEYSRAKYDNSEFGFSILNILAVDFLRFGS